MRRRGGLGVDCSADSTAAEDASPDSSREREPVAAEEISDSAGPTFDRF